MVLKDDVLDRFKKYKDDYKLSNIIYGMKAIEKMASVFHPDNKSSRNKWMKSMKHKSDNCVYFVYNHKKKGKSHRFLAPNSDLGESLSSKGNTIKKRQSIKKRYTKKRNRKNKIQKGGFCPPCLIGPLMTATGLGTAGYMVSKSSSSSNINGKRIFKRKESYSMKKNGKPIKKVYEQKNNQIYLNGKEIKPRPKSVDIATKRLNKKIKECLKSGFKKC